MRFVVRVTRHPRRAVRGPTRQTVHARTLIFFVVALVSALALGGCRPDRPVPEVPQGPNERDREALIDELNAEARRQAVTEERHGLTIADPYRTLEEDSELTRRWMRVQSARTERELAPYLDSAMRARLARLLSIGVLDEPAVGGGRVFYTKREGERERPALFLVEDGEPRPEPLVDPRSFGDDAAIDWHYPSPDGERVAFGISHGGDERSTLRVLEVDEGRVRPETIDRTKWAQLAWLPDGSGFYYSRYPAPGEPGYDPDAPESYFPRVFFHRLGTDPADDPRVFGSERGTDFPSIDVSEDGRWVVINVFRGWSRSDVYLLDRGRDGARVAPDDDHPLVPVAEGRDAITVGQVYRSTLYLFTDEGAPRGRIASVRAARATEADRWRDVVSERPQGTIEDWTLVGGQIAVHLVEDLSSRIRLFRRDGSPAGEIHLPARGSVDGLAARPDGEQLAFVFDSYLQPPVLLTAHTGASTPTAVDRIEAGVDLAPYTLTIERVPSKDGTLVPVQLVHREGLTRDGSHPVLLTGYGGFALPLLPSFTRSALYWLERGGVYAVANLRGGGELGEQWHRAGYRENKPRVFEDFEAVLEWLTSSGISRPDRIVVRGRSNGGLLAGAAITRAPGAFAAAASYVGLYDMVRFDRFPPAEVWVSEYGDPDDPEMLRVLHGYSPYHQVRDGVPYPAVLLETALQDTRVHWAHSTKFAARLQEATSSEAPILFHHQRDLGHGAGTALSDLVEEYARMYAFFDKALEGP